MTSKPRPSHIAPIAIVAVIAFAGSAGAATAAKMITGKDIKDGSITAKDIKNATITNKKIKDETITGKKIKDGSLSPSDFSGSVEGPAGPQGPQGAPGAPGAPGLAGVEVVSQTFANVFVVNSGGQRGLSDVKTVTCPAGKTAISGGFDLGTDPMENGAQRQILVSASQTNAQATGWSVQLFNNSSQFDNSLDLKVTAVCATVG
jgi:hypothetical protein